MKNSLSRRDFLKYSGAGALGVAVAAALAGCSSSSSDSSESSSSTTSDSSTTSSSESSSTSSSSDSGQTVSEQAAEIVDTAAASSGAISMFDLADVSNIDLTRKSTYNSDERYPEINVRINSEITTWTPWQSGQGRDALITLVYEPLAYCHDNQELVPCLAKTITEEDDTHVVVKIYDYIHDSDGNPMDAHDIAFCYQVYQESGNTAGWKYYDSVEAVDDYTLRFTWVEKIDDITALSAMLLCLDYTQAAYESHDFTQDPVGTGAYKLTELTTGSKYVIEPTDYWQTDDSCRAPEQEQHLDKLTSEVISESNVAYVAFEEGSLFAISPTSTQLPDFLEGGKYYGQYTVTYEQAIGEIGVGFNMSGYSPVSDDLNLRLAIAYGIDTDGIVDAIGSDSYFALHAEGSPTISGYQDVWDTMENYYSVYDVDLAKDYLAKSNYDGQTLVILNQSGDDAKTTTSQIIQQELEVLGIKSRIDTYEHAIINTYLYDVTTWDLFIYNWNGDPISQLWGRQSDITNYSHGYTETGINDPVLQEMIARVQTIDGYTDELILEIQQYFTDNCLLYAIYCTITWTAYDPCIASLCVTNGHKDVFWTANNYYLD